MTPDFARELREALNYYERMAGAGYDVVDSAVFSKGQRAERDQWELRAVDDLEAVADYVAVLRIALTRAADAIEEMAQVQEGLDEALMLALRDKSFADEQREEGFRRNQRTIDLFRKERAEVQSLRAENAKLRAQLRSQSQTQGDQMEFAKYRKTATQEMRPYVPGEDLSGVSVSPEDTPEEGGMIARNADNHADQWYVARAFFEKNYEPA